MAAVQQQVAAGQLAPADVTMDTIQQHLYTKVQMDVGQQACDTSMLCRPPCIATGSWNIRLVLKPGINVVQGCPPVDLMIRTSGETRLSDFLLPQSGHATLCFSAALWPDFSFLDMLGALAQYQRDAPTLQQNAQAAKQHSADHTAKQSVRAPESSNGVRSTVADSGAADRISSAAAVRHHHQISESPVSSETQHAERHAVRRRRSGKAAPCEGQPVTSRAVLLRSDGSGTAAEEASSPAAATCRVASRGKASMQTALQFDMIANSNAPALIS